MSVEKLERVMWRLRKRHPGDPCPTWMQLKVCIMYECGTDDRTYYMNRKALITLGWIKSNPHTKSRLLITDKDLEES